MAEGSIWEAFALRRPRGPGQPVAIVDVNRLGQRGETMLGWDTAAYAARAERLRLAHDRDRRPRRRGHRPRLRAALAAATAGRSRSSPARSRARASPASRTATAFTASRSPTPRRRSRELGGPRDLSVAPRRPERRPAAASARRAEPRSACRAGPSASRSRPAAPTARRSPRSAPRTPRIVALDGEVGNSTYTELFARGASRTGTSRCTSPSSRWSPPRSDCRRAAGCRSPPPSRPS